MSTGFHVKYTLFLSKFDANLNFLGIFSKKYVHIEFRENPLSGMVVSRGQTDGGGRTDMTKLIAAFHNFCEKRLKRTLYVQTTSVRPSVLLFIRHSE